MKEELNKFEQWLYKSCEIKSKRTNKEVTDIFSQVDISDAKLLFLDGISPEEYSYMI